MCCRREVEGRKSNTKTATRRLKYVQELFSKLQKSSTDQHTAKSSIKAGRCELEGSNSGLQGLADRRTDLEPEMEQLRARLAAEQEQLRLARVDLDKYRSAKTTQTRQLHRATTDMSGQQQAKQELQATESSERALPSLLWRTLREIEPQPTHSLKT